MSVILVTLDVFHAPIGWLNGVLKNAVFILVTFDVSHEAIGELNDVLLINIRDMSVMRVVTMLLNGTGSVGPNTDGINGVLVPLA